MKKLLLSLALIIGLSVIVKAQDPVTLSWNGVTYGDTVTVFGAPNEEGELTFHAVVHNNTDNGINVLVARTNIDVLDGTENSFCWPVICWSPMVDTSGQYQFIAAGGQSEDDMFSGHYNYNDINGNPQYGTSLVKYAFFDKDNFEIIDTVYVKYMLGYTGIDENGLTTAVSDIYPNPASSFANVDFHLNSTVKSAEIKIVNLVGKVVKTIPLNQKEGSVKVDLNNLSEGLYFYTVLVNGKIEKTKKLIVKR